MGSAQSELRAPIQRGDLAAARAVLDSYGDASPLLVGKQFNAHDGELFAVQPQYVTPARFAIMHGRAEILRLLVERGADVNESTKLHWSEPGYGGPGQSTLLHHAAKKLDAACTGALLALGADVMVRDSFHRTPLHHVATAAAPAHGREAATTAALLTRAGGADTVHARDATGRTPLHYAAERGCAELVAHLVSSGADANALDCSGRSSYSMADRHPAVQQLLLLPPSTSGPQQQLLATGASSNDGREADDGQAATGSRRGERN